MNYEQLSEILGEMACAAKNPQTMFRHGLTLEKIIEAEKILYELIEKAKSKKVLNKYFTYDNRADLLIEASCPSCGDDVFDCALFCECGQRLDWNNDE